MCPLLSPVHLSSTASLLWAELPRFSPCCTRVLGARCPDPGEPWEGPATGTSRSRMPHTHCASDCRGHRSEPEHPRSRLGLTLQPQAHGPPSPAGAVAVPTTFPGRDSASCWLSCLSLPALPTGPAGSANLWAQSTCSCTVSTCLICEHAPAVCCSAAPHEPWVASGFWLP